MPTGAHRSFRLTPGPGPIPPERMAGRLSAEDQDQVRRRFAESRGRAEGAGRALLAVFLGTAISFFAVPWSGVDPSLVLFPIILGGMVVLLLTLATDPDCPNCGRTTRRPSGSHCPACGGSSFGRVPASNARECSGCGALFHRGGRRPRRHFCSDCGVLLDRAGF